MAQIIMMARSYQKKPSEILVINDDYLSFCFDEAAYFMETKALDDKGKYRWNRFKWANDENKKKSNNDLISFMKTHHKTVV